MILNNRTPILLFILISCFINTTVLTAQKLYDITWKKEGVILSSAIGLTLGGQYIGGQKTPISETNLFALDPNSINGFDRNTIDNFSESNALKSDLFKDGIWVVPISLFLSNQGRENMIEIIIMYSEVFSLNYGITNITKNALGRYRPYAYNPEVSLDLKLSPTTRRSFFSGHVSHVASLSFFTATVFDDLYPESDFRYVVWAGAIAAPAITGYLRVKAGRHFPTDVVVGYGVGALVGYFIPELHKITKDSNVNIIGVDGGLGIVYSF